MLVIDFNCCCFFVDRFPWKQRFQESNEGSKSLWSLQTRAHTAGCLDNSNQKRVPKTRIYFHFGIFFSFVIFLKMLIAYETLEPCSSSWHIWEVWKYIRYDLNFHGFQFRKNDSRSLERNFEFGLNFYCRTFQQLSISNSYHIYFFFIGNLWK